MCNKIKLKKLKFQNRSNPKHWSNFKKKEAQHPRVSTGSSMNQCPVLQSLAPHFRQTSKTACSEFGQGLWLLALMGQGTTQLAPTARSMQGKVLALEGCSGREHLDWSRTHLSHQYKFLPSLAVFPLWLVCAEVQSRLAIRTTDRRVCERISKHGFVNWIYQWCSFTKSAAQPKCISSTIQVAVTEDSTDRTQRDERMQLLGVKLPLHSDTQQYQHW